jgi:hypothetical protein
MRTKALLPEDRQDQIVLWFQIRMEKGIDTYATINEIAKALVLAPSSKLRKIIEAIVPSRLEKMVVKKQGRWPGYGYRLARGTFEYPKKKERLIVINHKGMAQRELWE